MYFLMYFDFFLSKMFVCVCVYYYDYLFIYMSFIILC